MWGDHHAVDPLWSESGKGCMNIEKALFFLLMLAGAPGGVKNIQASYSPLDSWCLEHRMYRHNSTGQLKGSLELDDTLCDPSGSAQRDEHSGPSNLGQTAGKVQSKYKGDNEGDRSGKGKRRKIEKK